MLNGQKLILSPDGELPIISPRVRGSHQVITIPSQCTFFLVLPESKSKACTAVQIEESKESYKNGGIIIDQEEFEDIDYDTPVLDKEDEPVLNEKNTYVAFRPKNKISTDENAARRNEENTESKYTNTEMAQLNNDESHKKEKSELSESVIKYVTFSNNNWLSKFPKTLKNQEYSEEYSTFSPIEATTSEIPVEKYVSPAQSRREKYHILAQAVIGKRNPEKNIRSDTNLNSESSIVHHRPSQRLKLVKRSTNNDFNPIEVGDMLKEFTNIEKQPVNTYLKIDETSSTVPFKLNEDHMKVSERPKIDVKPTNTAISEINQSAITSQTTQKSMTTPNTSSLKALKQHVKITESHVQKIKSRAEQALAKVSERNFQKVNGRRSHGKAKNEMINPTVQGPEKPMSEKLIGMSTEAIGVKKETNVIEGITNFAEKLRHNRQANSTAVDEDLKNIRSHIHLKSKKSEKNADVENGKDGSSLAVTETTNFGSSVATEMSTSKIAKLKNFEPKPLPKRRVINVPELKNGKLVVRESRETTQHPAVQKLKTLPVSHRLGRVKTSPTVDADQMAANKKITDRIVENLKDGEKKLQSEPIVSPITADKTEEGKADTRVASLTADARIKVLEEKIKARRSEMERRLHEKLHKVNKRSATNHLIGDDVMDVKDMPDRFGSNELDVDVAPVLKHETVRRPRSVADFTVKLNEVNTYVDKIKKATDPKNNEITEEGFSVSPDDWKNTDDIRPSAENTADDIVNFKPKRKSIFKNFDEDDYDQTATSMINKLLSHMQKFWRYIKRTILF